MRREEGEREFRDFRRGKKRIAKIFGEPLSCEVMVVCLKYGIREKFGGLLWVVV